MRARARAHTHTHTHIHTRARALTHTTFAQAIKKHQDALAGRVGGSIDSSAVGASFDSSAGGSFDASASFDDGGKAAKNGPNLFPQTKAAPITFYLHRAAPCFGKAGEITQNFVRVYKVQITARAVYSNVDA